MNIWLINTVIKEKRGRERKQMGGRTENLKEKKLSESLQTIVG